MVSFSCVFSSAKMRWLGACVHHLELHGGGSFPALSMSVSVSSVSSMSSSWCRINQSINQSNECIQA